MFQTLCSGNTLAKRECYVFDGKQIVKGESERGDETSPLTPPADTVRCTAVQQNRKAFLVICVP